MRSKYDQWHVFRRAIYLLLIFNFCYFNSSAQNGQGGIWYFGAYAGLNFCSGTPVPLTNGALTTSEGCATICDPNCGLLFYTDGITVWNAIHQPMANTLPSSVGGALHGDPSATQSGVIVPRPQHPNIYYLFTVDANIGGNGCKYSVIDMNLNGGLGDVVPGQKNIMLFTPATEKITAVNHTNGYDIWVITHPWNANFFFTYLITANGFNPAPVTSTTGSMCTGGSDVTRGYLKASPSGNYVVAAIEGLDKYELFNFNASTGQLSILLSMPANYNSAYGVEFSPDGTYLYGSERWGTPVRQWNVSSGNPAAIMATQTQVGTLSTAYGGALQLAVDNKIYLARSSQGYLGIIHFPNNPGFTCNYQDQGIFLAGKQSREGLPTFITSYFNIADFTFQYQCFNDTTEFQITNVQQLDSAHWNFDDPASGVNNTSSNWNSNHVFSAPGIYDVELVTFRTGIGDTIVLPVEIYAYPVPNLTPSSVICLGSSISLDAGNAGYDYLWSNTQTTQTVSVVPPDTTTYTVTVTNHGCSATDFTTIYPYQITSSFTTTQPPCAGQPVTIEYTGNANLGASYNWNFAGGSVVTGAGQGPYTLNWSNPGNFNITLQVTQGQCTSSTSTEQVVNPQSIQVQIVSNDVLCKGDATGEVFTSIPSGPGFYIFAWSNGANTQNLTGVPAGNYTVTVTYSNVCTKTASASVGEPAQELAITVTGDNIVCHGDTNGVVLAQANGGTSPYSYIWAYNNQAGSAITGLHAGYYPVTVTDSHLCKTTGGGTVSEPMPLEIFSSADVYICPSDPTPIYASAQGGQPPYSFHWSNGANGDTITVTPSNTTTYSASVTDDNGCSEPGAHTTVHVFSAVQTVLYASQDTLCPGESTTIYGSFTGGTGGPYTAYYSDGTAVNLPVTLTPASTTTLQLYGMDDCEVPGQIKNITVRVMKTPEIDFTADELLGCQPFAVDFINSGLESDVEYLWRFEGAEEQGVELSAEPIHVFQEAGIYDVILKGINQWGCENAAEIQGMITVLPKPVGNMLADPTAVPISKPIIFFNNTTLETIQNANWYFGDGDSIIAALSEVSHIYTDTGVFTASLVIEKLFKPNDFPGLTENFSCYDTVSLDIHVFGDDLFFIANAFRPGSGLPENESFRPFIYGDQPADYQFIVYDRWGGKIFETTQYPMAWDGRLRSGEPAKTDTYTWLVVYSDDFGVVHKRSGNVLLLR